MASGNLKDRLDGNEIDLSLCNLAVIPPVKLKELAQLPQATQLDLSCNLLVSLPDDFCTLTHLVKIDLSKNKLKELPMEFGKLSNLQQLHLWDNQLTTLPRSFRHLKQLTWLDLKDNPLEPALKERAGDCSDEEQCQACARNVMMYMNECHMIMEKQAESAGKGQRGDRIFYWLSMLFSIVVVATALTVATAKQGGVSIKNVFTRKVAIPFRNAAAIIFGSRDQSI